MTEAPKPAETRRWGFHVHADEPHTPCNASDCYSDGSEIEYVHTVEVAALEAAERMRDEFFRDKEDFWARCERQSTLIEERDAEIARLSRELEEAKETIIIAADKLEKLREVVEAAKGIGEPTSYNGDDDSVGHCAVCGKRFEHEDHCAVVKLKNALAALEEKP